MANKKYIIFDIHCAFCQSFVLKYHKYGSGKGIVRIYFHRIQTPTTLLKQIEIGQHQKGGLSPLKCPDCQKILGTPKTYTSGKQAYQMRRGFFHKKKIG